jgi:3-dehydroquinate synthetase
MQPVGGKTGVDLPQGKNLVGAFKQPAAVLMDTAVLATLPGAEFRAGLAEVVKHGVIAAPRLFEQLEAEGPAICSNWWRTRCASRWTSSKSRPLRAGTCAPCSTWATPSAMRWNW